MAEIIDADMTPAADLRQQKRSFAKDITNKDTTTSSRKKSKPESPPEEFVGGWSTEDLSSSEPHSDATEESEVARRTYGMKAVVQRRHAPQISKDTNYYEHVEPNAAKAAKARQSGEGLLTFVLTSEQPLEDMPIDGGISHTSHVPEISSDVVGVHEARSAGAKNSNEVQSRKKQGRGKGTKGPKLKGVTRSPPFTVWFGDELVGKYEGGWQSALPDIKRKRPGEYMTQNLLSCLLNIKRAKILKDYPKVKKEYEVTKFTAKY
ncbi:unnamed protein product [Pelagomonas calceolata]|uniref:Uncharacterized protein n=1 Tax=Pelagomonas calceolata TaxID=35677 RepID=A0A8J2T3Q4_9STRA|nr:unnamed protein product [Pelagomonas calceolata]|mmetsp:Transcript_890/g.2073  ORF Transcript_890/g.2073 Transcript_890/m.2073 type:complete len:263 (+) Transcript_890:160-948(+)